MDSTGTLEALEANGHTVVIGWGQEVMRGRMTAVYLITTDTGYRGVFEACQADDCLTSDPERRRTPCPIPTIGLKDGQHPVGGKRGYATWRNHAADHCHGWHEESVWTMAERVLATYPKRKRRK